MFGHVLSLVFLVAASLNSILTSFFLRLVSPRRSTRPGPIRKESSQYFLKPTADPGAPAALPER